jgi:NADH-quinone oxidoreductase subunit J
VIEQVDAILFYVFAFGAVSAALVVVGQRNPTFSAFGLIVTLGSLSGIFGLLGSPFIAVLQLVVYAGAIMVLFMFVIMLLNVKAEEPAKEDGPVFKVIACFLAGILVVEMGGVLTRASLGPPPAAFDASTRSMAGILFSSSYLYPFEATSILLLAALVGAVILAKREI